MCVYERVKEREGGREGAREREREKVIKKRNMKERKGTSLYRENSWINSDRDTIFSRNR